MPRIVPYQQRTRAPGPTGTRPLSGIGTGAGMEELGSAISRVGGVIEKKQRQEQEFKANSLLVNSQAKLFEQMEQSKTTMDPSGKGFSNNVETMVNAEREALMEGAETEYQRNLISSGMDSIGLSMFKHSKSFEIQTSSNYEAQKMQEGIIRSSNAVRANPSFVDDTWKAQESLITNAPNIIESLKPRIKKQAKENLYDSGLDGMITTFVNRKGNTVQDVDGMLSLLTEKDLRWQKNASRGGYDNALDRLQSYRSRISDLRKSEFVDAFNEEMKYLSTTGDDRKLYTQESIAKMDFNEKTERAMLEQLDSAQRVGKVKPWINNTSVNDIVADLNPNTLNAKLKKDPTKTNEVLAEYQSKISAFNSREKQAKDNTPTYVMSVNPDVENLYRNFEKTALSNAPVEDIHDAADEYVNAMQTRQKQLWPDRIPSILPKVKLGELAKAYSAAGTNPQQLVALMQHQQQVWGKHWPMVVKDMQQNKILSSGAYVAATMYDRAEVRYLADEMIAASTIKASEFKKDITETEYLALEKEVKEELQPFFETIRHMTPESYNLIKSSFTEAATKLAAFQTSKNVTPDISDIVSKMVLDKYEFEDDYRVPKELNVRDITDKIDDLYSRLGEYTYVAPPRDSFGLDEEATQSRLRNHMEANAKIVNDNDLGVRVIDGHGRQVYVIEDGKSKVLKFTWDQILAGFKTSFEKELEGLEPSGFE